MKSFARLSEEITVALNRLAAEGAGSAHRIERVLNLTAPPDLDAGEITDKGYINQRLDRERRGELVDEVTAVAPSARTVCRVASAATTR